jgi:hypothetical protein
MTCRYEASIPVGTPTTDFAAIDDGDVPPGPLEIESGSHPNGTAPNDHGFPHFFFLVSLSF